jgi:hypothetical protein
MQENTDQNRSRDTDALQAALHREGCAICAVLLENMQMMMDSWQYEGFTNVDHRHELIRTRGFCPLHTWQLAQLPTSFQLGVVYREVLTDIVGILERQQQAADTAKAPHSFLDKLRPQRQSTGMGSVRPLFEQCYFCQERDRIEARLIGTFVGLISEQEIRDLLSQSTGLCLMHFGQARAQAEARDAERARYLLDCQHTCLKRALAEVGELVRKHDYRFKDEPRGDEMTSWRRAAEMCAGEPGVR